jgi:hypothetical protein
MIAKMVKLKAQDIDTKLNVVHIKVIEGKLIKCLFKFNMERKEV